MTGSVATLGYWQVYLKLDEAATLSHRWQWSVNSHDSYSTTIPNLGFDGVDESSFGQLAVLDITLTMPDVVHPADAASFTTQPFSWVGQSSVPEFVAWTFLDGHGDTQRKKLRLVVTNPDMFFQVSFSLQVSLPNGSVFISPDPSVANREPPPDPKGER